MIIKRKMFSVTVDKDVTCSIAAESMQQAIDIMNKWRTGCNITSIHQTSDVVLTVEDIEHEANKV